MSVPTTIHLHRTMNYVRHTAEYGSYIKPKASLEETDKTFLFQITGRLDADYATEPKKRHSVSGATV
jgi:hypothetical protein